MPDYNNPGQVTIANGTIPVATVMGISNPAFVVNGNAMDFASAISPFTFKKLTQNEYDSAWNKGLKIRAMGNNGTVQYTFMPAVLPVSNFSQSDLGNRSFGTKMNVWGKNIMFLQTNFWTNEFVALTDDDYISSIQKQLIGTYSKSISIVKQELSILENTLFCLATGQFFFTDELGKRIQDDPNDPNNLAVGDANILWTTQAPRLKAENVPLGNVPQAFLKQELNAMSNWLMTWPLTINTFVIGYSLDRLELLCSYYMRTNLAYVLNLGWPTDANEKMVKKSSYDSPEISRWFNMMLTNNGTVPYFQNDIGMVTQEQMPSTPSGDTYEALPLGYGINNICPFNYTDYIVAMTTYDGAIEQYYTTDVPFNPYNIPASKTWYRLGYMWGWGQVHVPNYWGTSWMILDPNAYLHVIATSQTAVNTDDYDWAPSWQTSPTFTSSNQYIPIANYYYTSSNSTVIYVAPGNNVPGGAYQIYLNINDIYDSTMNNPASYNGIAPTCLNISEETILDMVNNNEIFINEAGNGWEEVNNPNYGTDSAGSSVAGNYPFDNNSVFIYTKVYNGLQYLVMYYIDYQQLLTDMVQAQAVLLEWEPGMGYDRYCFPNLPTATTDNLSYTFNWPDSSTSQTIGNSLGLNFLQWAMLRSLRAMGVNARITNGFNLLTTATNGLKFPLQQLPTGTIKKILNLCAPGYNQLYMAPYNYIFTMPNDAPYIANTSYSQTGSIN